MERLREVIHGALVVLAQVNSRSVVCPDTGVSEALYRGRDSHLFQQPLRSNVSSVVIGFQIVAPAKAY